MRIALVRGHSLNPWELANFEPLDGVTAFASRAPLPPLDATRIPVHRLPSPADLLAPLPAIARGGVMRFSGSADYLVGLERALRGYDIAHVAELANPYSLQAIRARRAGRCERVVATVWENIPLPNPENAVIRRRARAVAGGVDACIAITEDARLHLELAGVPPDRIEVIPMGIDLDRFVPSERAERGGPLRVLSVCRLVAEKGVEDLVVAARLLRDRGVEAEITLVGAGPLEPRLRALAEELGVASRVRLEGSVPYGRIPALLAGTDVFVLASAPRTTWREQFGFAVVEAMAAGLPVVAGNSGSLDEVVGDPSALVKPHDAGELAAHLEELSGNPELRRERGARNRARAEERYDRTVAARRMGELYERVLSTLARA
ncbi:MAG TPA: glycosyltransferase family 4 protein [Thermoleophilaceae bacterium]|jgi:glycosyltransferase involved in cell wall biosynthesis|nr:glycosyltransferase family 4 protein [Thermoleophilaceae bacterium]